MISFFSIKPSSIKKQPVWFFLVIGGVSVIALGVIIFSLVLLNRNLEIVKTENAELDQGLQEIKDIVEVLVAGNDELEAALSAEQTRRLEAEEDYEKSIEQLTSLEVSVEDYRQTLDSQDIVKIINSWSPRIARVKCELKNGDQTASSKASGVATITTSGTRFITNKHVVLKGDLKAESCNITFATSGIQLEATAINIDSGLDLAFIDMNRYVNLPEATGPVKTCSRPPVIGDGVIILGYPSVGSDISITATEGIISGLDDDYYITSAKIEQGNSGGAAISIKDNCLLGLPTLVVAGRIESLARILPIR
ncbi:MAG: trypsin-like peptidase domain-containing protein [Candidatus Paceibacterota bacterium]